MIWLKIGLIIWLAVWNALRGYHYRPLGIAVMSISLGLALAFFTHIWWILFASGIPVGVCLGISDKNRGVWCSLVALGASFAILLTGNLAWYWFIAYCGGNYLLGWIGNNKLKLKQIPLDFITGAGFGVVVLLV